MTIVKTHRTENCALKGMGGQRVDLIGVHASGILDGMFLRMKLRQTYRNDGSENIETIYTFPLAWGTTLLGMSISINGKTMKGTVIEKMEAQERYEDAIIEGDTPVMVEWAGKDLYSANLGNLLPGEDVIIEIEYGQVLNVNGGKLRLALPCTLAPRYGESSLVKNFLERHFVKSNPSIERHFSFELQVFGSLAKAKITSPTHRISAKATAQSTQVALNQTSLLDRDLVLHFSDLDEAAYATAGADVDWENEFIALVSFIPSARLLSKSTKARSTPINLKVLVDCSGSMAGDSITQARIALSSLIDTLKPTDRVSFSKFGHQTANILRELTACTPEHIAALRDETSRLEADMGGTEMNRAIQRVMSIKDASGESPESVAILLITDGEVWDIENIVATVRSGGHKIYAIGVGSSPAESLLQEMALASAGHCSMVSPKEDMRSSVLRMAKNMRERRTIKVEVEFAEPIEWQSPSRLSVDAGTMVHIWTKISKAPSAPPRVSWFEIDDDGEPETKHEVALARINVQEDRFLARMLAAQQILEVVDEATVTDIALRHQLVTRFTNLFLVFEREDSDKSGNLPMLKQIEHMLAAGWQGNGSVPGYASDVLHSAPDSMACASVFRTNRPSDRERTNRSTLAIFKQFSIALMLPERRDNPFRRFIEGINEAASTSNNFRAALKPRNCDDTIALLSGATSKLKTHGLTQSKILALLFLWLVAEKKFPTRPTRFALRLVRGELVGISKETVQTAYAEFEAESRKIVDMTQIPDEDEDEDDFDDYEIPDFLRKQAD
jgi:Ca-activated chloride channel family protein